jgi:hypothetical protein
MILHEVFQEIQVPPEYVSERGVKGLLGWLDSVEYLDPYSNEMTYGEQVGKRQTWMAAARETVFEATLTHNPCFPSVLLKSFDSLYDEIRNQLGSFENLNQCFDYESFVQELTTVCIQSFESAARAYAEILEHADGLRLLQSMGMTLTDEERTFLKNLQAVEGE